MSKSHLLFLGMLLSWQLIFVPTSLANQADDTVKIGSYLTPGLIKNDGSGLFNQLNDAIFSEINKKHTLNISSLNRAKNGIKTGALDAYFPELWEQLPGNKDQYIVSDPIFYKRIILFTLKNSQLSHISDFEHYILGAVRGFSYGEKIKSNTQLKLVYHENDMVNINLLLNKRISGVIGGFPGTVLAVKKMDLNHQIKYDLNKPVAVLESFYVCANTKKGIELCQSINQALNTLKQKNRLSLNEETGESLFSPTKLITLKTSK